MDIVLRLMSYRLKTIFLWENLMLKEIKGKENNTIKLIRSLHTKKGREKAGLYFVEGLRIVSDTVEYAHNKIEFIIFSESFYKEHKDLSDGFSKNYLCIIVTDSIFQSISDTIAPQGILAVLRLSFSSFSDFSDDEKILILDSIQDPGNMGTIIRTAEAMGIKSIFLTKGCTDIYSPKVLRSAMGFAFRTKFYPLAGTEDILHLKNSGYKLFSTALSNKSKNLSEIKSSGKSAIVIGNEANGISSDILDLSDFWVKIPMSGKIESLNAAVAASIVMYHFTMN